MPRNKTVKLKTPGLTLKRKILGVWTQSPHEETSHFLAYPCTDSYEEPKKLKAAIRTGQKALRVASVPSLVLWEYIRGAMSILYQII